MTPDSFQAGIDRFFADPANDNESFHRAIANGHLDVAKYLVSTGAVFPDSRM